MTRDWLWKKGGERHFRRRKSKDKNMCREGAVIMKITEAQSVGGGRKDPEATETSTGTGWCSWGSRVLCTGAWLLSWSQCIQGVRILIAEWWDSCFRKNIWDNSENTGWSEVRAAETTCQSHALAQQSALLPSSFSPEFSVHLNSLQLPSHFFTCWEKNNCSSVVSFGP